MKISPSFAQPFTQFPGKSQAARAKQTDNPAAGNVNDVAAANKDKAISAANAGRKEIPPGLERVQARLQATPVEDLNKGQANAMSMIHRNITRYLEVQAMATPAPEQATDITSVTSSTRETS